jgi:hypothetical protein
MPGSVSAWCFGKWFWGLAWEVTEPTNPPYGAQEPTREAAMDKFKAAYVGRRPQNCSFSRANHGNAGGHEDPPVSHPAAYGPTICPRSGSCEGPTSALR